MAMTALRKSSFVFHRVTTAATTSVMNATMGCLVMRPSAELPSLPAALNASPICLTLPTRLPMPIMAGPMAAAMPRMATTAVCACGSMSPSHDAKAPATSVTGPMRLSSTPPSGSMAPCRSRTAVMALVLKLSLASSAACCAAPPTSPKLSCTPARDSIMPMALSSPREDHSVEASAALSYSLGIWVMSPRTAFSTSSAVAPPLLKLSKTCWVPSENWPMDFSMRPSDRAVRNSLR